MSTLEVNKITPVSGGTTVQVGESGDTINIPAGATIANAGTSTGFGDSLRPNVSPLIINGNQAISQRATSVASITSSGYHTIDRLRTNFSGTLGTWTQSQSTNVPSGKGFANSFKMDCTTADASPSVADRLSIRYNFEGQDLQLLKKGISDAEKITLAFWVKSSKTGVHIVNIVDQDNTRHISKSYTVSSSNTWEQVVLNFDGDTTGTLDDDNGQSLYIDFYLGAGTNYTSGTLATSWEAKNNVNTAVGQVNLADSTSNEWYITGIQLEVGEYTSSTLPPFQHESYGNNLVRCHRYFLYTGGGSAYQHHGSGVEVSSTAAYMTTPLSCPFRASPSITANNTSGGIVIYDGNTESAVTSVGTTNYSPNTSLVNVAVNASGGGIDDGNGITVYSNANSNAGFLFDAEL